MTGITLDEIDFPKASSESSGREVKERIRAFASRRRRYGARRLSRRRGESAINGRLFRLNTQRVANLINQNRDRIRVKHWTAHDLEADGLHSSRKNGDLALGHWCGCQPSNCRLRAACTMGTYVQCDYAAEKRDALELWANRLVGIIGAAMRRKLSP